MSYLCGEKPKLTLTTRDRFAKLCGLMATQGARAELLKELRKIGPRCWDAADYMRLTVEEVPCLPFPYAINFLERLIVAEEGNDWSVWAGIAEFVAIKMGIEYTPGTILEAATVMNNRASGIHRALQIA